MTPGLPVAIRASFSAPSTASAPELQKNTCGSSKKGVSSPNRSASSMARWWRMTTDVCMSVRAWASTAATTRGWQWPVLVTAMPLPKSRKRRPSTSTIQQPSALSATRSK
jgi:hypothetical protein